MKIIKQSWSFEKKFNGNEILKSLEKTARTCYKSENHIEEGSAQKLVSSLIKNGHEAMLEHESVSVRIITDRGVTHEIVRHRVASYAQESTRYCNYSKDKFGNEITVILPVWFYDIYDNIADKGLQIGSTFQHWYGICEQCEEAYFTLLQLNQSPQQARAVLPNSLKTEIVMTANLREWRHFFKLRCSPKAHPQMRELALNMFKEFKQQIPIIFDDLEFS